MENERRRYARVAVEVDVELSLQIGRKISGRVTDISEAGIFVESDAKVEIGDIVVIRFSGQRTMFGAAVRRLAEKGFGAEFGHLGDAHHEIISRFIPKPERTMISTVVKLPAVMLLCDEGPESKIDQELKSAGFEILKVRNTEKAIASMESFDVAAVISDYMVGGKDTLLTLRKIKELKQKRNIPVFLYSGRYDVPCKKFEEYGIPCFLKSSTSPKSLVSYISKSSR